jgi:hypothetical protein
VKKFKMATTKSRARISENFGRLRKNLRKVHGGFVRRSLICRAKRAPRQVAGNRFGGNIVCAYGDAPLCANMRFKGRYAHNAILRKNSAYLVAA